MWTMWELRVIEKIVQREMKMKGKRKSNRSAKKRKREKYKPDSESDSMSRLATYFFFLPEECERMKEIKVTSRTCSGSWRMMYVRPLSFFAGGCLGWSRAERPSVSWTKVSKTLWSNPPVWLYVNLWQKHARRPSIQTTTIYTRWQSVERNHPRIR